MSRDRVFFLVESDHKILIEQLEFTWLRSAAEHLLPPL